MLNQGQTLSRQACDGDDQHILLVSLFMRTEGRGGSVRMRLIANVPVQRKHEGVSNDSDRYQMTKQYPWQLGLEGLQNYVLRYKTQPPEAPQRDISRLAFRN